VALKTSDIISAVRAMRNARGGFELMDRPRDLYYTSLPDRLGVGALSEEQLSACAELGILADRDQEGVLLQIFTKPIGDRATLFLEIIQVGEARWPGHNEPQGHACSNGAQRLTLRFSLTSASGVDVLLFGMTDGSRPYRRASAHTGHPWPSCM
jgi:hypothetical protein